MRRLSTPTRAGRLAIALLALSGCAAEASEALEDARSFRDDARARRSALLASVAERDTPYGALRVQHYALSGEGLERDDDWDRLPEFLPRVRERFVDGVVGEADAIAETELASLEETLAAGERAFDRYPAQIDLSLTQIRTREDAARIGLHVEASGRVRGLIEAETASGWVPALTCSGCHGRFDGDAFRLGIPNERLAIGAPSWRLGTMDVTDDGIENPVRPSDLRPIALQARLHHAGNVVNGRLARMVRIETLLVTQANQRSRPSRTLVAAISLYLDAAAESLPRPDETHAGARSFSRECARCHAGEGLSGAWVSVDEVGTDAAATTGGQRGTGGYRAPSLLGIADRHGLLHDGSAADLRALLQLEPSTHVGHGFGLSLSVAEREALIDYLASAR